MLGLAVAGARSNLAQPATRTPAPLVVTLEPAPGELGKAASTGSLAVMTVAKGKEVLLFDTATGELTTYLESGASWGKPLRLHGEGAAARPPVFHLAANNDQVAFAGPSGVTVFDRDTGDLVAEAKNLHHAAGIAATPEGWAVSLTRLPFPEIEKQDRDTFGGPAPRFVVLNDKLEIWRQGPAPTHGQTSNQSAARTLRLAAGPGRLFAAEVASYKLYEFDRNYRLHGILADPTVRQEDGQGLGQAERNNFIDSARQRLAQGGADAARPAAPTAGAEHSEFFTYKTAVWDLAWDPGSHQLIVLLEGGIAGDEQALDLVDPDTGELRRLLLRFPVGAVREELVQLALGQRYLWLRNYGGRNSTWRLDRAALDQAHKVGVLKVE